ncbi:MAG: hypothetical protein ACOYOB_10335 [Myxococcota bacterium]
MARYRLRPSLTPQPGEGRNWVIADPMLSRAVRLGEADARLARALVAGGSVASLAKSAGLNQAETAVRLTGLARLYLLDGRRSRDRIALQAEKNAFSQALALGTADQPIEWPRGLDPPRHGCIGNGGCCGATFLGPLNEADVARVAGLAFAGGPHHRPGDVVLEQVTVAGRVHTGMRRDDSGRCVAQRTDRLCGVHADHGAPVKPMVCRQFPLRMYRSPRGVHVSLLLACDGYAQARDQGEPWPQREAEVRALLAEGASLPRVTLPLEWSAGLPVPEAAWWVLRDELYALEDTSDAWVWLAAVVRHVGVAVAEREAACREGEDIVWRSACHGLDAFLQQPLAYLDIDAAAKHADALREAACSSLPGEAARLRNLALGMDFLRSGRSLRPGGGLVAEPAAKRHLIDIVANDLALQVALGQLDAGLGALTRRLVLAESIACALAADDHRDHVTGADTTRALHVVARSDAECSKLAILPQ